MESPVDPLGGRGVPSAVRAEAPACDAPSAFRAEVREPAAPSAFRAEAPVQAPSAYRAEAPMDRSGMDAALAGAALGGLNEAAAAAASKLRPTAAALRLRAASGRQPWAQRLPTVATAGTSDGPGTHLAELLGETSGFGFRGHAGHTGLCAKGPAGLCAQCPLSPMPEIE
jgi:hypothetical protein